MQEKLPGYYDNINISLLNSIPADAEIVLEIGCASGALGAEYKKKNTGCTYYGVEIDPPGQGWLAPCRSAPTAARAVFLAFSSSRT